MLWNKARRSDNVNDTREGKDARTLTGKILGTGLAAVTLASAGLYSALSTPPDAPSPSLNP
ncbi:metalloprotease, partial [Pseudomonas jessenii]